MLIEELKQDLIRDEGTKKSAYQDSRGYWTIGTGRCIDVKLKCGLSPDEISYLLNNDIRRIMSLCESQSWYKALDTDNRKRACLNMVFNLGLGTFLKFTTFISLLLQKRWAEAADDLKATLWAKEIGERAIRIEELIRNG